VRGEQILPRSLVNKNGLAEKPKVRVARTVLVRLADRLIRARRDAAGQERGDIELLPARQAVTNGDGAADWVRYWRADGLPAEAGFADQAHLTRWFRRYYGITPGAYQPARPRGPLHDRG
jgi:AraC-like DNA-binding protein